MPRIRAAFVTYSDLISGSEDDQSVFAPASRLGIDIESVCWDSPVYDWKAPDLVVLRSPWDYPERIEAFLAWIQSCEKKHVRLFNSPRTVQWNANKRYLREFGDIAVPTRWLRFSSIGALREEIAISGWRESVIKPVVSSGARLTVRFSEERTEFPAFSTGTELMIQPFLPEIQTHGEWSLIYFNSEFSHSAIKKPKPGDFRVQSEHGGRIAPAKAPTEARRVAESVLARAPRDLLYARVDLVETRNGFQLMELEVIEPALYLFTDPGAPARFARAMAERVQD